MEETHQQLVDLAHKMLTARKADLTSDTMPLNLESLTLFARLRAQHRDACQLQLHGKSSTHDARVEMDRAQLELQNLMYEQQHLSREIKKCLEYDSQYQHVPLHEEAEFRLSAAQEGRLVSTDAHQFMLQRLQFELDERQRLEAQKKSLQGQKNTMTASNAAKKAALDDLDRQLEDFVGASKEAAAKEFVSNALKEAHQYSGSRPSPLTQIDRLLARVRLFCHLHSIGHFGPQNYAIYWSDMLKHGGMGTAWNEKKAGRRAYKHIYADLLQHQEHPLIVPLLEDERGKPLDHLEAALDAVIGRPTLPKNSSATKDPPTPSVYYKKVESGTEEPAEDALLELAENDQTDAAPPSKKRKRAADDEIVAIPDMLPIPTVRMAGPARSPDEESIVKQGLVNELVQTGQWSGTRPSVINSLNVLISRINTLIRVHAKESVGSPPVTIFWSDCIKYGGISQAWSSKKAGKAAFKTTYAQLIKYKDNPAVQALLASSNSIDIKTAETELAKLTDGGTTSPSILPPMNTLQASTEPAAAGGTSTPRSRRRSTPEWSASPEPVDYIEMLEGRLTPLASSETTDQQKAASFSDDNDELDELADVPVQSSAERSTVHVQWPDKMGSGDDAALRAATAASNAVQQEREPSDGYPASWASNSSPMDQDMPM